jgi:hypothetical protein
VLFLGPLQIFSRKLWQCEVKGLSDYSAFAERYQSLVDLSNSVNIVRDMRLVPVSPSILLYLAVAALLPLVLFKCPLADLLGKFFGRLSGL